MKHKLPYTLSMERRSGFHFNSGLEKLIGAPQPTIYKEMSYEHGFKPVNESDVAQSSLSSCGVDDISAGRSFRDLCAGISSLGSQVSSSRSSGKDGANASTGRCDGAQGPGSRLVTQKSASAPSKLVGGCTSVSGKAPSPALSRARQAQGRRPAPAKHGSSR